MKKLVINLKTKNHIVSFIGSKKVGYLYFEYAKDASYKRNIEIQYMYVNPNYRNIGVG